MAWSYQTNPETAATDGLTSGPPNSPTIHVVGTDLYYVWYDYEDYDPTAGFDFQEMPCVYKRGTPWSKQDEPNNPTPTYTNQSITNMESVLNGTDLEIVWVDWINSGGATIRHAVFDTTTDTWGAFTTLGTLAAGLSTYVSIAAKPNGDVVVAYCGSEKIMGTDALTIEYSRRVSGSWTHNVLLYNTGVQGLNARYPWVVCGSTGQVHCFFSTGSAVNCYLRCISDGFVLRTARLIADGSTDIWDAGPTKPFIFTQNSTEQVGFFIDPTTGTGGAFTHVRYDYFDDDTNPTLTDTAVASEVWFLDTNAQKHRHFNFGAVAADGTMYARSPEKNFGTSINVYEDGGNNTWSVFNDVHPEGEGAANDQIYTRDAVEVYGTIRDGLTGGGAPKTFYELVLSASQTITGDGGLTIGGATLEATGLFGIVDTIHADGDTTLGGWTDENDGTVNIWQSIDEEVFSDADYIKSEENPVADLYRATLHSPAGTVDASSPHIVSIRYRKSGPDTANLIVRLVQGASTVIASWTYNGITETYFTAVETLTAPQVAAITDYTDLSLELEADVP